MRSSISSFWNTPPTTVESWHSRSPTAIGHYRRYNRKTLPAVQPLGLRCQRLFCLDSIGFLASLFNRWLFRKSIPTEEQVLTWDRFMVPVSSRIDRLPAFRLGKSAVGVWTKNR